ncbi:MAG: HlyD family efflux transporter periplasmic adaptor subunit [Planctomycetes bacterium]|nr:HlyD family efflux transporter periplasmic adaptor subunit [Planctomycetota bacterium]
MKAWVIVGIVLVVVTIVGAQLAYNQSPFAPADKKKQADADQPPAKIIVWGYFDVEPGVAGLYPKQFGDVTFLAPESTRVKKGELLLQVDDVMARFKIDEAKADEKASENQLAEAQQLPEVYKLQAAQQQAAINALGHEIKKTQSDRDTKLKAVEEKSAIYKTIKDFYTESLGQLAEKKSAEEKKLKEINLRDPKLKIAQAQADLSAKRTRVKQAEEILKHFQVLAPSDGTVLRVYVHKGETLGPNPRIQALDFLPDADIVVRAEILQEWARFVKEGAEVSIEDDTYHGPAWKGKVKSISKWYAPIRTPVIEPFRFNDVRTLECIISVSSGDAQKRIGQRVRGMILSQ